MTLAGFVLTILAGLFGSPVGSHNFAIIFVWIAWWTALKLVFIPAWAGARGAQSAPSPCRASGCNQGGIFPGGSASVLA